MKISELIKLLEEVKNVKGDCTIKAFHHDGANSLRAYPQDIKPNSFVDNGKDGLIIGGWYD